MLIILLLSIGRTTTVAKHLLLMVWEVLYAVGAHAILPLLPRFNRFNMWIQGVKIEGRDKWNDHRTQSSADIENIIETVPLFITHIWRVAVALAVKSPSQYWLGLGLSRQQILYA
jgi:hypothetical protein